MKCHNQTEELVQVLREIDNNGREVTTRGFTQKKSYPVLLLLIIPMKEQLY